MSMLKLKIGLFIAIVFLSFNVDAQCNYNLNNYKYINCAGDNTGEIDITVLNTNASFWWTGPFNFTSNSLNISSLLAGDYVLHIMENQVLGDTSSAIVCYVTDTITIEETLLITANFKLLNMCAVGDSADVITTIYGGTPPYSVLWSTGATTPNTLNLAVNPLPYSLLITDANNCVRQEFLKIDDTPPLNTYMSSVGTICKDDNSGSARVFVSDGTPPYQFTWSTDTTFIIVHDSFSVIESLLPEEYIVKIIDDMGCETRDTVVVKSHLAVCITVYKAFSPNDDDIHEFWEIENINLYPEAIVQVYDRTGRQVYNRRNYANAEEHAFSGKDQEGRTLPSGTYYYIIDLENGDAAFKGTVTIVR